MGQEIFYCSKCQIRLVSSDFERGKAFRIAANVACSGCVRGFLTHLADPDAELERLKKPSTEEAPSSKSRIVLSPPRGVHRTAPVSHSSTLIGAGVVGLVILSLIVTVQVQPSQPGTTPGDDVVRSNGSIPPSSLPTSKLPERTDSIVRGLDDLDLLLLPLMEKEHLGEAALVLEAARKRNVEPEWHRGIDSRLQKLDETAKRLARPWIDLAVDAATRDDTSQVELFRSRVATLGVKKVTEDFERAVAAVPPPAKPVTPSPPKPVPPAPLPPQPAAPLELYRGEWVKALGPAAARNLATSLQQLRGIDAATNDPAVKKAVGEDIADLVLAAEILAEVPKLLPRWSKGTKVKLEYIGESGTTTLLEGAILDADAKHVTVHSASGVLDVPSGEIGAGSIADLLALRGEKRPTEGRAVAVLAALDGQSPVGLPPKYAALRRAPDPGETQARRLFWNAEEGHAFVKSRGKSGEIYAALLDKHAATAFVIRNKAFIEERLAGMREVVFLPEDLAPVSGFAISGSSKVETFWLSSSDSAAGKMPQSVLEGECFAQANLAYKAWVFAGGCCQEVLAFHLQGTGISGPSAKDAKAIVTAEPASEEWIAVKSSGGGLRKKHADHAGPKEPTRWMWVELGALKFSHPGSKKLRLLSEHKGFSVAFLVVSAVRQVQPREDEVKSLMKHRRASAPRLTSRPSPPEGAVVKSFYVGGKGGGPFEDCPNPRKFLRGIRYSVGPQGHLDGLQPLYSGTTGESEGPRMGTGRSDQDLIAKPGYVVGGMVARGIDRLYSVKLIFMRVSGARLVVADRYESGWVGTRPGGEEVTLGGDGTPVLGMFGRCGMTIDGGGLFLLAK